MLLVIVAAGFVVAALAKVTTRALLALACTLGTASLVFAVWAVPQTAASRHAWPSHWCSLR